MCEHLNRTLMETQQTILQQSGLPDRFWGEAVSTVPRLRNMTGTMTHDKKKPVELLTSVARLSETSARWDARFGCLFPNARNWNRSPGEIFYFKVFLKETMEHGTLSGALFAM